MQFVRRCWECLGDRYSQACALGSPWATIFLIKRSERIHASGQAASLVRGAVLRLDHEYMFTVMALLLSRGAAIQSIVTPLYSKRGISTT